MADERHDQEARTQISHDLTTLTTLTDLRGSSSRPWPTDHQAPDNEGPNATVIRAKCLISQCAADAITVLVINS